MAVTGKQLLVLWDIDHTLIETRGVGRKLYELAFRTVTGRPVDLSRCAARSRRRRRTCSATDSPTMPRKMR